MKFGILGYGSLGKYLANKILEHEGMQLVYLWNRSAGALEDLMKGVNVPQGCIVESGESCDGLFTCGADVVVEVAHPDVTRRWAVRVVAAGIAFFTGSPTVFADAALERDLREASRSSNTSVLVPSGAFWGLQDVARMAKRGTLRALSIEMRFRPEALRLEEPLAKPLADFLRSTATALNSSPSTSQEFIVYEGPVRPLCSLAPNNVNTMAAACLAAAPALSFDSVTATLVADPLTHVHVVTIHVTGPVDPVTQECFTVHTVRRNPAAPNAVTGAATYTSFLSSLVQLFQNPSLLHSHEFVFL